LLLPVGKMSNIDILPTGSTEGRLLHVGKNVDFRHFSYMKARAPTFAAKCSILLRTLGQGQIAYGAGRVCYYKYNVGYQQRVILH